MDLTCNQISLAEQTSAVTTRYNMATTAPKADISISISIYNLSSDTLIAIMTRYLRVPEIVKFLRTCRHFEHVTNKGYLWQILFKIHNPNWQDDRFHCLIQSRTQDREIQELAYYRLYALRAKGLKDPWRVKTTISVSKYAFWRCHTGIVVLSNSNIAMGVPHRKMTIWSSEGVQIKTPALTSYKLGVACMAALPGGGMVTAAILGHLAHLWSPDGKLLHTLNGHTGAVRCVAVFSDGRIVTGSRDHTVGLWSPFGMHLATLTGHTGAVTRVAVLPSGGVVSGSEEDGTAIIWSREGMRVKTLNNTDAIKSIAVLPCGGVVTASESSRPYCWNQKKIVIWSPVGVHVATLEYKSNDICIAILSNGVIAASAEDKVYLWSSTGERLRTFKSPIGWVTAMAPLPNGGLVTGSTRKNIYIWSLDGTLVRTLVGHKESVSSVAVLQNGDIVSLSLDFTLRIWSPDVESLMRIHRARRRACVVS